MHLHMYVNVCVCISVHWDLGVVFKSIQQSFIKGLIWKGGDKNALGPAFRLPTFPYKPWVFNFFVCFSSGPEFISVGMSLRANSDSKDWQASALWLGGFKVSSGAVRASVTRPGSQAGTLQTKDEIPAAEASAFPHRTHQWRWFFRIWYWGPAASLGIQEVDFSLSFPFKEWNCFLQSPLGRDPIH